jgi:threonine synthase
VFDLFNRSSEKLRNLWENIESGGDFTLDAKLVKSMSEKYGIVSGKSTHADRIKTIRDIYFRYGIFIDTHTADGIAVAGKFRESMVKMVVMETASAAKFEENIIEATGKKPTRPEHLENIESLPTKVETIEPNIEILMNYIERYAL